MALPPDSDWGQSDWGAFIYGAGGRGIFGYPASDPTVTLALRVLRPYHTPVEKRQPVDYSNGNDPYIYNKGLTEYTFGVSLKLSRDEAAALKDFYDNCADGKANQIYYAEPDGTEHVARIMDNKLDFPEEAYDKYTGSLTLRKEA
jgi:hypothetical protein